MTRSARGRRRAARAAPRRGVVGPFSGRQLLRAARRGRGGRRLVLVLVTRPIAPGPGSGVPTALPGATPFLVGEARIGLQPRRPRPGARVDERGRHRRDHSRDLDGKPGPPRGPPRQAGLAQLLGDLVPALPGGDPGPARHGRALPRQGPRHRRGRRPGDDASTTCRRTPTATSWATRSPSTPRRTSSTCTRCTPCRPSSSSGPTAGCSKVVNGPPGRSRGAARRRVLRVDGGAACRQPGERPVQRRRRCSRPAWLMGRAEPGAAVRPGAGPIGGAGPRQRRSRGRGTSGEPAGYSPSNRKRSRSGTSLPDRHPRLVRQDHRPVVLDGAPEQLALDLDASRAGSRRTPSPSAGSRTRDACTGRRRTRRARAPGPVPRTTTAWCPAEWPPVRTAVTPGQQLAVALGPALGAPVRDEPQLRLVVRGDDPAVAAQRDLPLRPLGDDRRPAGTPATRRRAAGRRRGRSGGGSSRRRRPSPGRSPPRAAPARSGVPCVAAHRGVLRVHALADARSRRGRGRPASRPAGS